MAAKQAKASVRAVERPVSAVLNDRASPASFKDPTIQDLVRKIAQKANFPLPGSGSEPDSTEAVFAVEIDGLHYTLFCSLSRQNCHLSPREREIARLVSQGLPNKTISAVLDISCWTVGTHLRRIFAKLGVSSRAAMVARLLEEGLLGERLKVD